MRMPRVIGPKAFGTKPATQEMIGKWVKMLGCSDEMRVVYDKDGATGIAYGLPGETAKVVLYTIEAHGHHWPGGKSALPESLAGRNTAKIAATDVIWEFFKRRFTVDTADANKAPQRTRRSRSGLAFR